MNNKPQDQQTVVPAVIDSQDYNCLMVLAMMRVMRQNRIFERIASQRSPMQFKDMFWYRVAKEIVGLPGRRNKQERNVASQYVQQALTQFGQKQLIDFKDSQLATETDLQIVRPKVVRKPTVKHLRALELVARCIKLADKREHIVEKSSNPFSSMVTMECQNQGLNIYVRGQSSPYGNGSLIVQVRENKRLVFSTYGSYIGGDPEIKRFIRGPWENLLQ